MLSDTIKKLSEIYDLPVRVFDKENFPICEFEIKNYKEFLEQEFDFEVEYYVVNYVNDKEFNIEIFISL